MRSHFATAVREETGEEANEISFAELDTTDESQEIEKTLDDIIDMYSRN